MFFIAFFGVLDREKHIGVCNNIVCPSCGHWSRYEISKYYRYFHIFFIPLFKWNVSYIAKSACCGSLYELDLAVGREFEKNPATEIRNDNLRQISSYSPYKYCAGCRMRVPSQYNYCPYCGGRL